MAAGEYDSASFTYDSLGRMKTGVDADWQPLSTDYDALDRVTRATDAVGQPRDYTYDANGNLAEVRLDTLVDGVPTRVDSWAARYDLADRRTHVTDAGGYVTQYQYDEAGNLTRLTNPDNYTLGLGYDPAHRPVMAYDAEGHSVSTVRDDSGRVRSLTDPNGHTRTFAYYGAERDGRLKDAYDALNRKTTLDYDAHGNRVSLTDNLNRTSLTSYDELDRPTRVVGALYTDATYGNIRPLTKYSYNPLGQLTQVLAGRTDASGGNPASDVVTPQLVTRAKNVGWR